MTDEIPVSKVDESSRASAFPFEKIAQPFIQAGQIFLSLEADSVGWVAHDQPISQACDPSEILRVEQDLFPMRQILQIRARGLHRLSS